MTTLYITKLPESPGMQATYAVQNALNLLSGSATFTMAQAATAMKVMRSGQLPYILGESDDPEAIKAARIALAEAGFTAAQDLPAAAVEREQPSQAVSYNAARIALVCLGLAHGDPHAAMHHSILLANAAGESPDAPGTCMEATGILLDVFPPTLIDTIRTTIEHYTGFDTTPKEDPA